MTRESRPESTSVGIFSKEDLNFEHNIGGVVVSITEESEVLTISIGGRNFEQLLTDEAKRKINEIEHRYRENQMHSYEFFNKQGKAS